MSSFREKKYTSKSLNKFPQIISDATFAFQTPEVIAEIAHICGFKNLIADPYLYAGGISAMAKNHYLNPHIDNSHDAEQQFYRRLNLLYYVTPGWQADFGGNLEVWDAKVLKPLEIPSLFNRLVVMETHRHSYHSVNRVRVEGVRCCVSNYYFQKESLEEKDYFHVTSYVARPEQPFRRLVSKVDNSLRTLLRQILPKGVGKKDLYQGSKSEINKY
ncbi:2OG-Fe(II) oxygenase [Ancylothrix sp. D3o]|uniref:2OG-Fe(II) oxygenase n=1 Tax=Ancylothrix sp. D3o TaxID=2953691 RepID=UPI0021BA6C80|nr:2OG-Fe(II) oxygenase [Ancylothrix sp. D3o]